MPLVPIRLGLKRLTTIGPAARSAIGPSEMSRSADDSPSLLEIRLTIRTHDESRGS